MLVISLLSYKYKWFEACIEQSSLKCTTVSGTNEKSIQKVAKLQNKIHWNEARLAESYARSP
jgi:hypothetical protein